MLGQRTGWILSAMLAGCWGWGGGLQAQALTLGAKGGVNSATIAWSASPIGGELDGLERLSGPTFGAMAEIGAPGRLRARAEILWTRKGFVQVEGTDRSTLSVSYLEVPVFLGWAFGRGDGPISPQLYAGPWLAWEASCRAKLDSSAARLDFDCDEVPDDPVLRETVDWGWALGGLLDVELNESLRSQLDVRYSAGIRNVDAGPQIENVNARHRGVSVMVGLSVPVG